jgi:hypothetical protein
LALPADFSNLFHHYQNAIAAGQIPANQAAAVAAAAAAAPYVCQPLATAVLPYGLQINYKKFEFGTGINREELKLEV